MSFPFNVLCPLITFVFLALPIFGIVMFLLNDAARHRRHRRFPGKLESVSASLNEQNPPSEFTMPEAGESPRFPIIIIGLDGAVFNEKKPGNLTCAPSMIGNENGYYEKARIYSGDGWCWKARTIGPSFRPSLIYRLIHLFAIERTIPVEIAWQAERPYSLHELQEVLCLCVGDDDETLTQFNKPKRVVSLIRETATFQELHEKLRKARVFY